MTSNDLLLVRGDEIADLLESQEKAVLGAVSRAYQAHAQSQTAMPPDSYLRFPEKEKERIISKVAYIGGEKPVAGIKWIASFPGNLEKGMDRASATLILNDLETGRPQAVMESSIISAKRTAASAALGARALSPHDTVDRVGLLGCGYINFETLRFLLQAFPEITAVDVCDLSHSRAAQFANQARDLKSGLAVYQVDTFEELLAESPVVALATTAVTPHIESLEHYLEGTVLLHTSLRDFAPELILLADNVVDDVDKVCSNQTSVHLAEQSVGHRSFIRATIGEILTGDEGRFDVHKPFSIYSPFGLGILDMAVAQLVYERALEESAGTVIDSFLPTSWLNR